MKKYLPLWIVLGVLLLLLAGAGGIWLTALKPVTVEAGAPLPDVRAFQRYSFLSPEPDYDTAQLSNAQPTTYTLTFRVWGIPRRTVLTIEDTTPPVLTARPQTCFLGDSVQIADFVEVQDVTEVTLRYVTQPDVDSPGEQTVTICATDRGGNVSTVEVPLTVHGIAHRFTVEAGTAVTALRTQIADAIEGKVDFGEDFAALNIAQPGEQVVTITLDGEPQHLQMTVIDTTAPTGVPQRVGLLAGQTARPDDFLRSVTDASEVTVSFVTEPDYTVGEHEVSLRLVDAAGNTCVLTSSLSVYAAPSAATIELGTGAGAMARILLAGEPLSFAEDAVQLLSHPTPGGYTLTLLDEYANELTQQVTFVDTTPPTAQVQNRTAYVGDELTPGDFVQAIDDATAVTVNWSSAAPDFHREGAQPVGLRLTDAAGNTTELSAMLTVVPDTEPPVIYGAQDRVIYIGESVSYRSGVSAWDNRDGAVSIQVDSSAVRLRAAGKYSVVYTATDAAGNTATQTVTFTVSAIDLDAVNALADEILGSILRDGMTEYQRARAIYDWTTTNMRYTAYADKSDYIAAAFYGFRNGRGDCYVYYAVSRVLLTRAGFENLEIQRDSIENPHYWNLVKYAGSWYHFDTCPHYAGHPLTCFLLTDAEVKAYSENHVKDYYHFDASRYPATP